MFSWSLLSENIQMTNKHNIIWNHNGIIYIYLKGLEIIEANQSGVIKTLEGGLVTLTCVIHGAMQFETLSWTSKNKLLASVDRSSIQYSFTAKSSFDMAEFICRENNTENSRSLTASVQLIVKCMYKKICRVNWDHDRTNLHQIPQITSFVRCRSNSCISHSYVNFRVKKFIRSIA